MQAQGLLYPPSSNSEGTGRHNPNGADRHSVRPRCDSLPIAVSWFLPSSDGFAWEDTPAGQSSALSQPQWPSPPRQLQRTPASQTEFVICDHTIEKRFWVLKGPLQVHPLWLHKDERPVGLILVLMIALLIYCLREDRAPARPSANSQAGRCSKRSRAYTVVRLRFSDGSQLRNLPRTDPLQTDLLVRAL